MRGSDFAELKAFATVVERASFARAADQLGLSASALSQTIRQLEAAWRSTVESHHSERRSHRSRCTAA